MTRGRKVSAAAVAAALVLPFAGDAERAARQRDAAVGAGEVVLAITGRVLAKACHGLAAGALLELDVDDAGNGVRAVLSGGAVAQHLHGVDGQQRQEFMSCPWRPVARAEEVDQRNRVAALPLTSTRVWSGRAAQKQPESIRSAPSRRSDGWS